MTGASLKTIPCTHSLHRMIYWQSVEVSEGGCMGDTRTIYSYCKYHKKLYVQQGLQPSVQELGPIVEIKPEEYRYERAKKIATGELIGEKWKSV